jgi:hypothetical protein
METQGRKGSLQHSINKQIIKTPSKQGGTIPKPKPPQRPPEGKGKK